MWIHVEVQSLPWPSRILSYISPVKYIYQGFILNEFRDRNEIIKYCKYKNKCLFNPAESCCYQAIPGTVFSENCDIEKRFSFIPDTAWLNFLLLLVVEFAWGLLGCIMFKFRYQSVRTVYSQDKELCEM